MLMACLITTFPFDWYLPIGRFRGKATYNPVADTLKDMCSIVSAFARSPVLRSNLDAYHNGWGAFGITAWEPDIA